MDFRRQQIKPGLRANARGLPLRFFFFAILTLIVIKRLIKNASSLKVLSKTVQDILDNNSSYILNV